jgi:hypothetical protein
MGFTTSGLTAYMLNVSTLTQVKWSITSNLLGLLNKGIQRDPGNVFVFCVSFTAIDIAVIS